MSAPAEMPAVPKPSASLLLIRDGEPRADGRRLQVLLTERNGGMPVSGGAFVFPGGKVEPEDGAGEAAFRHAAIREAFEEAGVVLARNVDAAAQDRIMARYRAAAQPVRYFDILRAEGAEPLAGDLLPFGHWVTPVIRKHRFDTKFYLAVMPEGQAVRHDGVEAVSVLWTAPEEMIELFAHDTGLLMFPTRLSLGVLARAGTVAEAVEIVKNHPVVPVMPEIEKRADGIYAHVPVEAGFGGGTFRFQMREPLSGRQMIEPV